MKKFVLSVLMFTLFSMPVWASVCDRGRISDIPGHHGGGGVGFIIIVIAIILAAIFNRDDKKS